MKDFTPQGPEPFSLYDTTIEAYPDLSVGAQQVFVDAESTDSLTEQVELFLRLLDHLLVPESAQIIRSFYEEKKIGIRTLRDITSYLMDSYRANFPTELSSNSAGQLEVVDGSNLMDGAQQEESIRPDWSSHVD